MNAVIERVDTRWLRIPLRSQIADSTHVLKFIDLIVVEAEAGGITGSSYMLSFDYAPAVLKAFVEVELKRHVIGLRSDNIRAVFETGLAACEYVGQSGLAMWAISAIDVALWDLLGRRLGVPAATLFGRHADAVPAYGSGGWLSYTDEQLADEIAAHRAHGFRAVKIKIGGRSEDWDVARVKAVRQALGPDVQLMADANQALSLERAMRTARRLDDEGIAWLEEPLRRDDIEGYARLAASTAIPLAAGEREYGAQPFRRLAEARALAILQPDLLRVGGVTGWRQVGALAETSLLGLAPHFYKEHDVHLAASYPNLVAIEVFDWLDPLVEQPLAIRDGLAMVPDRPGFGVEFRREAFREYEVH
jgi:L-alanine-DL-glutamate epimerase-like enolase superfamily enzyme